VDHASLDQRAWNVLEDSSFQVYQALSQMTNRDSPSSSRVLELNNAIQPEHIEVVESEDKAKDFDEILTGDDILTLPPNLPYNVHFPFRRGELNLHPGVGGSLTSLLVDLQQIWTRCIEKHLGISPVDFKLYKAVLVIPALYKRNVLKHFITLLLIDMGFSGCFVVQDHVAATFGSGLSAACVVDVGDQKTSVSCVEDGISQPNSRIVLDYGGSDISLVLHFLSSQTGFTYKNFNTSDPRDGLLLHQIKQDNCHLNLEEGSLVRHIFNVERHGLPPFRYSLYLGDERIAAPLAFFQVDLMEVSCRKEVHVMGKDQGDPEDPHDHLYLRETSRKYTKTGDEPDAEFDDVDIEGLSGGPDVGPELIPLDQAIIRSIDTCMGEEMKRKMYGAVLVVGGGFRFPGASQYLQARLNGSLGANSMNMPVEVLMDVKDGESDCTVWRGASVMASMESAQELWLKPKEWAKQGQKLLRERAPFPWA